MAASSSPNMETMSDEFRQLVVETSRRPEVGSAMRALYQNLGQEIDARRPVCSASGRCCRFEEYGHRLYVTTIELAAFVASLEAPRGAGWDGTGCPFQAGGLCSVHSIRPFGCRIFFCDPTSTGWQNQQYERFHARIKRLHAELNVPYRYMEWRQGLELCGLASPANGAGPSPAPCSQNAPQRNPLSLPQLRL